MNQTTSGPGARRTTLARPSLNPYQQDIARLLGLTDPADLEAVEDSMRTARGTLNGLSAAEFAGEARTAWTVVRASRVMTEAGLTGQAALDPAVHTAACIYVDSQMTGPLTRPLTFRATEQEHGEGPEWVTYAIPAADWRPDMTREQASTYDQGGLAPHGAVGYAALCRSCGEIFSPGLTYADRSGLEHDRTADERPCGGAGDLIGWWG
jgi:hypothetical protein